MDVEMILLNVNRIPGDQDLSTPCAIKSHTRDMNVLWVSPHPTTMENKRRNKKKTKKTWYQADTMSTEYKTKAETLQMPLNINLWTVQPITSVWDYCETYPKGVSPFVIRC